MSVNKEIAGYEKGLEDGSKGRKRRTWSKSRKTKANLDFRRGYNQGFFIGRGILARSKKRRR